METTAHVTAAAGDARAARDAGKPPPNVAALASIGTTGLQVKRPGEAQWVSQGDARRATAVRVFRCPDGSTPQEELRALAALAVSVTGRVTVGIVARRRRLLVTGQRRQQRRVGRLEHEPGRDGRAGGASGRAATRPSS